MWESVLQQAGQGLSDLPPRFGISETAPCHLLCSKAAGGGGGAHLSKASHWGRFWPRAFWGMGGFCCRPEAWMRSEAMPGATQTGGSGPLLMHISVIARRGSSHGIF